MNKRLFCLAVLPITVVLLTSCQNSQHVTSQSSATLSNILTITRPNDMEAYVDYLYLLKTPEFNPEITSYSVTIDSLFLLGIQPVPTSSEATCSVTIDGKQLSTMEWYNGNNLLSYKYESGKTNIVIKIEVTNNDETTIYTIAVHYNGTGNNISKDLLMSNFSFSLPEIVLWDSMGEVNCYGRYGSYKCTERVGDEIVKPTPELSPDIFNYSLHVGNHNYLGFDFGWAQYCSNENVLKMVYTTGLQSDTFSVFNASQYYSKLNSSLKGVDTVRMYVKRCGCDSPEPTNECQTGPMYTFLIRK